MNTAKNAVNGNMDIQKRYSFKILHYSKNFIMHQAEKQTKDTQNNLAVENH